MRSRVAGALCSGPLDTPGSSDSTTASHSGCPRSRKTVDSFTDGVVPPGHVAAGSLTHAARTRPASEPRVPRPRDERKLTITDLRAAAVCEAGRDALFVWACISSSPAAPGSSALTSSSASRAGRRSSCSTASSLRCTETSSRPPDGVTFIQGNVGDERSRDGRYRASRPSSISPPRSASASRCTRSTRYVRGQHAGHRVLPRSGDRAGPRPARLVVASSMSIYGEGEYECAEHGTVAPPPRPRGAAARAQLGVHVPVLRRGLAPDPDARGQAADPDLGLRDHEARPRGALPRRRPRLRRSDRGAALLQRLRPGQALSNPYTGVAAIFASRLLNGNAPLIFEDGLQSRDFIHVERHRRGDSRWRSSRRPQSGMRSISARAVPSRSRGRRGCSKLGSERHRA